MNDFLLKAKQQLQAAVLFQAVANITPEQAKALLDELHTLAQELFIAKCSKQGIEVHGVTFTAG